MESKVIGVIGNFKLMTSTTLCVFFRLLITSKYDLPPLNLYSFFPSLRYLVFYQHHLMLGSL